MYKEDDLQSEIPLKCNNSTLQSAAGGVENE